MTTTTTKQMIARMHDGHGKVLAAIRDGRAIADPSQGDRTAYRTLVRWGACDWNGLTDTGEALISGWMAKFPGSRIFDDAN